MYENASQPCGWDHGSETEQATSYPLLSAILHSNRLPNVDYQPLGLSDQRVGRQLGHVFE